MAHSPSTKSLRAFEAAARLGSVKAAAEQLHLSASAVSRRIQTLEEELGQQLFVRDIGGLVLTESGRYYAEELRAVFRALDNATSVLRKETRRRLTIFAPSMIVESISSTLPEFDLAMPGVDLELHTVNGQAKFEPALAEADVVFLWGNGELTGWVTHPISQRTHLVPVCSPRLIPEGRFLSVEELPEYTWVIPDTFEDGWKRWYEGLGLAVPTPRRIIRAGSGMVAGNLAIRCGGLVMGLGMNRNPFWGITLGTHVPAHPFHTLAPDCGFHIAVRPRDENTDVPAFCKWFLSTVWTRDNFLRGAQRFKESAC